MTFRVGSMTDVGAVRAANEDSIGVYWAHYKKTLLAIVADGMGGHNAGHVASKMAVQTIEAKFKIYFESSRNSRKDIAGSDLAEMIQFAHDSIYMQGYIDKQCHGMGTTLTVALISPANLILGHVGDSRAYILRAAGLTQLTEDHTLVNELIKKGEITAKQARSHSERNILLEALGAREQTKFDVFEVPWRAGERLLLCSDGLTNMLEDTEIADVLRADLSAQEMAQKFIDLSNEAGGEDNISAVVVFNEEAT